MNMRNSELSALFDGELEAHEVRAAVRAALGSDERRADWQLFALISDGLRGESADVPDLTANVMERIREEPVVLAPRKLVNVRPQHPLFALAASIAGVAVVGWLALAGGAAQKPEAVARLAAASPAPSFVRLPNDAVVSLQRTPRETRAMPRGEMNEYLLAHYLQGGTFRPGDSTRQIRPVVMDGRADHP